MTLMGAMMRPLRTVLTCAIVIMAMVTATSIVQAEEGQAARLSIKPANYEGDSFNLDVVPGQSLDLAVQIGNTGTAATEATSYAADVFTLVNGGIGIEDVADEQSGVTLWTDFPTETRVIAPGEAYVQHFHIVVPDDAQPGEYVTGIVVQGAPTGSGDSQGVAISQITRQAIGLKLTIAGELHPTIAIGDGAHRVQNGTSLVTVDLHNTGNASVKPTGEFRLFDESGAELTRFPVSLNKIYAATDTKVEIPFTSLLNPGTYTASLTLDDPDKAMTASADGIVITVGDESQASNGTLAASVDQQTPGEGSDAQQGDDQGIASGILIAAIAGSLIVGVAIALAGNTLLRRRNAQATTQTIQTGAGDGWD